jgi:hypothetical protein
MEGMAYVLDDSQREQVETALWALGVHMPGERWLRNQERRRLSLLLQNDRRFDLFVQHAHEHYELTGGFNANGEFVDWLVAFISEHRAVIFAIIQLVIAIAF